MKIVCPTCEATYEVPEAVLAAKRQVRCARCNNDWVPGDTWQPGAPPASAPAAPAPTPSPSPTPAPAPAPADDITPPIQADTPPPIAAAELPEAIEPPEPPPAPEPEPVTEPPPPPAPARLQQSAATAFGNAPPAPPAKPATRPPVAAWIATVVALSIFAGAGIVLRAPIMKAWPPSERLYAALGMHIPR